MEEDNNNYAQNQAHGSDDDSNDTQYTPRSKAPRTHRTSFTLSNNNTASNRTIPNGTQKKVMTEMRHQSAGNPDAVQKKIAKWRMRERVCYNDRKISFVSQFIY